MVWILAMVNPSSAQEILLDKMEKGGDLVCYPSLKDPNQWYYLPDQPRLAVENGKPQFSFLKYARTQASGKAGTGRADGGGIVHFLVTYGASETRVRQAQKALQERHPDATIVGPIVYRKGSFALITSFKEGDNLTTKTVAVGKAPLMEGQKAAVSMALTREGAELLWESFQTSTPDISLVFDMEFAGVREPFEATLEADWAQISKHQRVKAGFSSRWFGADVDILLQELRQTGAVKITTKGESAPMEKILDSVNNKLLQVMFDPAPTDDISRAAADNNSYNSLNQAVQMLRNASQTSGSGSSTSSTGTRSDIGNLPGFSWNSLQARASNPFFSNLFSNAYADPAESTARTESGGEGAVATPQTDPAEARSREAFARGRDYYSNNRFQEAHDAFREGLDLYSTVPNPQSRVRAGFLNNMGVSLMHLNQYDAAIANLNESADLYGRDTQDGRDVLEKLREAEELARPAQGAGEASAREDTSRQTTSDQTQAQTASEAYNRARQLHEEARTGGFEPSRTRAALDAYETYQRDHSPTGTRAEEIAGNIRNLQERLAAASQTARGTSQDGSATETLPGLLPNPFQIPDNGSTTGTTGTVTPPSSGTTGTPSTPAQPVGSGSTPASTTPPASTTAARPATPATGSAAGSRSNGSPGFSLVASYQMKNIKRTGKLVYNLNHFSTETQAFAMSENIGDIFRKYGKDSKIFRAVTIDDPVFKQREILVTLDGQDASTFTKYLNFVTVKMKKQHQAGDQTTGEVVITPDTFNKSGNNFSLTYGWKDDPDRNAWLNYEYQAIWSFFGGVEIRTPWTTSESPMIALAPPHRYRTVTIEGDGSALTKAEVRHAVINLNCRIGDKYITRQATLKNNSPAPSLVLDLPEDPAHPETKVFITWVLANGKQVSSPEAKLEGDIIYWDQVPKGGA